jgi:plastocyanin
VSGPGSDTDHTHELFPSQAAFASSQPKEGSPETQFPQRPDKRFFRKFYNRELRFPDGGEFEMWSFEDERSGRKFPAPLIRVTEGDIVHTTLKPSKRVHTIHHHGMEPDPRNDGVGHTSFEVSGEYTYQWKPDRGFPGDVNNGAAGSYFYHCHVNTTLHVQMGMVGALIVDPLGHPDFPVEPGARRSFVDGPLYDVASEYLLLPYALDPSWHELDHAAGLSGEDVGLNRFEPSHYYLLGGNLSEPPTGADVQTVRELRVKAKGNGHPGLVRVLNLDYFPTRLRFTDQAGAPAEIAEIIAHDGRAFRDTSDPTGPSRPVRDVGNPLVASTLAFGSAERYDMLLQPPAPGRWLAHVDFHDWTESEVQRTLTIPVTAT